MKKVLFLALSMFLISGEAMAVVTAGRASRGGSTHAVMMSSAIVATSVASHNYQNQIARNNNPMFSDGFVFCYFENDRDKPDFGEVCDREEINGIRKKRSFKEYVEARKGNVEYLGYQMISDIKVAIYFKRK